MGSGKLFTGFLSLVLLSGSGSLCTEAPKPVKIGVIFSLSGPMAETERPLVDAAMLAVEEINRIGAVLGRPVAAEIVDGRSDWPTFAREAERLITREHVVALLACWTSACRKAVLPVVEQKEHLLLYPLQYEGLEQSNNILYTGSTPNQQIIPAMIWGMKMFGKRVYLAGSDYVFPRTANMIMKEVARIQGVDIVGERYLPLDATDASPVVAEIKRLKPDFVMNTINGPANAPFFQGLDREGLTAKVCPVISTSIGESGLLSHAGLMSGRYAVWSYFQTLETPRNRAFVAAFKDRFGRNRVIDDPMEAAYIAVYLWAQAVRDAGSFDLNEVNRSLLRQSINAPQGIVSVSSATRHLWRAVRIGRSRPDGQFDVIWDSGLPERPLPFPSFYSPSRWKELADGMERG